jgi:hypothetical protein
MNKRDRREKYLSTRRPTEWLDERAEQKAIAALPLEERYKRIKDAGYEIPEEIRKLACERGWEE